MMLFTLLDICNTQLRLRGRRYFVRQVRSTALSSNGSIGVLRASGDCYRYGSPVPV